MDNQQYQSQQSTNQGTEFQSEKIIYVIIGLVIAAGIFGGYLALASWQNLWPFESKPEQIACTQEAMLCPDGTAVGRTGPNCEFAECPVPANVEFCGGIAGVQCQLGYSCELDGDYPDAGGTCVKQDSTDCLQVEISARNNTTGEVREFPTPCHVPQGWTPLPLN